MSRAQGGIIYLSQNDWEDMRYVWDRVLAKLPQIRDMTNITPNMSDFATLNVIRNFRDHPQRVKGLIGRIYWGYLHLPEPQEPLEPTLESLAGATPDTITPTSMTMAELKEHIRPMGDHGMVAVRQGGGAISKVSVGAVLTGEYDHDISTFCPAPDMLEIEVTR